MKVLIFLGVLMALVAIIDIVIHNKQQKIKSEYHLEHKYKLVIQNKLPNNEDEQLRYYVGIDSIVNDNIYISSHQRVLGDYQLYYRHNGIYIFDFLKLIDTISSNTKLGRTIIQNKLNK